MQGAGLTIRGNLGFHVLLKDTSTCEQEELGLKPAEPQPPLMFPMYMNSLVHMQFTYIYGFKYW